MVKIVIENNTQYDLLVGIEEKLTNAFEVMDYLEGYLDIESPKKWADEMIDEIFKARLIYDKKRKK